MQLTAAIQESLLAILCYDDTPSGARFVRSLVQAEHFDSYYREIAEAAHSFIDRFEKPPGEHTLDLIDDLCRKYEDSAEFYKRIFTSLEITKDEINRDFVLSKANLFVREQRLKVAIGESIDLLSRGEEGDVEEAEALVRAALDATSVNFDHGLMLGSVESLRFLDEDYTESMPTGIPAFDDLGHGPAPGQLLLFSALYGKGKSWFLVHLAKQALLARRRVLYITLEMSEDEVAKRLYQSIFSVSKRPGRFTKQRFVKDEKGKATQFEEQEMRKRPDFKMKKIKRLLQDKAARLKTPLIIKQFPTGSLTPRELEAYMENLEGAKGFIPHLVLVDYADLMTTDAANYRRSLSSVYVALRGIAVKRNVAVATASQLNREAIGSKKATGGNLAESLDKAHTADVHIVYNQTDAEKALNLARLYLDKGRGEKDRFTVLIAQQYGLGQFCLDSALMGGDGYWDSVSIESNE